MLQYQPHRIRKCFRGRPPTSPEHGANEKGSQCLAAAARPTTLRTLLPHPDHQMGEALPVFGSPGLYVDTTATLQLQVNSTQENELGLGDRFNQSAGHHWSQSMATLSEMQT